MGAIRLGIRAASRLGLNPKSWGAVAGLADNALTVGGLALGAGAAADAVKGTNKAWVEEAIEGKDLDDFVKDKDGNRDLSSIRDDFGWRSNLPFLGPSDQQILKALNKREAGQINSLRADALQHDPELALYLGSRRPGETSQEFETRLAAAVPKSQEAKLQRRTQFAVTDSNARFHSDAARQERFVQEQRRRDDINRFNQQQINQMQMFKMGIEREDRRDRRDARMQLVAALTGSLGNLGDAFLSI